MSKIGANINGRDCFCDSSCQDFRDCCSDHAETCPELTTKKTSQQTTTAITTLSTTKKPKNTRPPTIKDESWIFDKLFESLQNIIDEKFGKSTKYQNFIDRLENTRFYFLNAEHNCRFNKERSLEKRFVINETIRPFTLGGGSSTLERGPSTFEGGPSTFTGSFFCSELSKKPYVGEPNKGKVKNYDGIFEKIENPEKEFTDRANAIAQGFQKYIKSYYYSAQVRFPI